MKVSKIIKIYVELLIKNINNKKDYKEYCFYLYENLLKDYGWDKTQEILDCIEQTYKIKLEY